MAEAFNWCGLHNEAVDIIEGSLPDYDTETDYFKISHLNVLWLNYSEGLLKSNRIEEARQVFTKVEAPHFAVDVKNFYTMQFCKLNSEMIKNENPRMATSMRKSAIEIASKHQFNFFETIYSRKD